MVETGLDDKSYAIDSIIETYADQQFNDPNDLIAGTMQQLSELVCASSTQNITIEDQADLRSMTRTGVDVRKPRLRA
jgi:hypothetical protein